MPSPEGRDHHHVYYSANKMDPEVRFDRDACQVLAQIPRPFRKSAIEGIIKEAKAQGVTMVDKGFLDRVNEKRKAG